MNQVFNVEWSMFLKKKKKCRMVDQINLIKSFSFPFYLFSFLGQYFNANAGLTSCISCVHLSVW